MLALVALIAISSKYGIGEKRLLLVRSARLELEEFGATDNLSHLADESRCHGRQGLHLRANTCTLLPRKRIEDNLIIWEEPESFGSISERINYKRVCHDF